MVMTAGELSLLRADTETLLPDTCSISRPTRAKNDSGGWSDAYTTVVDTIACRIGPITQRERIQNGAKM